MPAPRVLAAVLLSVGAAVGRAARVGGGPIAKAIDLLGDLKGRIEGEGEVEDKTYKKYMDWCSDTAEEANRTIKAVTSKKGKLEAGISKLSSDIESATMKIEELGAASASSEADLKKATALRKQEASEFATAEKELMETIDTLDRALKILARQAEKGSASLMQVDRESVQNVLQSLAAVVSAASFSNADRQKLLALMQDASSDAGGAELDAPAAAVYEGHSEGVVDLLEDLKDKAESQLDELRKTEATAQHQYNLLKQSLESEGGERAKEMDNEKSEKAASEQAKASAEGDLAVAVEELKREEETLDMATQNCEQAMVDHEASVKSRGEEIDTIAEATKALQEAGQGAAPALVQLSARSSAGTQAAELIRRLSRRQHSAALAQLAARVGAVMRYGAQTGADPFAKVKSLIEDMISKLEAEASSEATEKAFCDKEMAETGTKKDDLTDDVSKLKVKIEQAVAKTASLKDDVKDLQDELSALAKAQAEMDQIRQESHATYVEEKASLEQGLEGVRKALSILRTYYANKVSTDALVEDSAKIGDVMRRFPQAPPTHQKASGAGGSIIGLLEAVESRIAEGLAKEETQEADLQAEYEKVTQENKVSKATKEKDAMYKEKEIKALDKEMTKLSSSKDVADSELAAVTEYYTKLQGRCIAKPEAYEERKRRREVEIQGLKEAISALESEAALVQTTAHRGAVRRHFRGSSARSS